MKSNYPPDWFGCLLIVARQLGELDLRVYLLRLRLSAASNLNEERVSKVANSSGLGFELFLSGIKRCNEGLLQEEQKEFEDMGDFHGTIRWFLLFWF